MNFDKESISEKKKNADGVGVGRGRGGGNTETKTVCQTVKRGKIQNSNHARLSREVKYKTATIYTMWPGRVAQSAGHLDS